MSVDELNKEVERINKEVERINEYFKTVEEIVNEDYAAFLANVPHVEHACTPSFYQNDRYHPDYGC